MSGVNSFKNKNRASHENRIDVSSNVKKLTLADLQKIKSKTRGLGDLKTENCCSIRVLLWAGYSNQCKVVQYSWELPVCSIATYSSGDGWSFFFWPCSSYIFGGERENLNGQCCLLSLLLHYCSEPICWRIPANESQQPTKQSITYIPHLEVIFIYVIVSCQGDVWAWAPRWKNFGGCYTVDIFPVGRTRGCYAALQAELPHNTTHVWKDRVGRVLSGALCLKVPKVPAIIFHEEKIDDGFHNKNKTKSSHFLNGHIIFWVPLVLEYDSLWERDKGGMGWKPIMAMASWSSLGQRALRLRPNSILLESEKRKFVP